MEVTRGKLLQAGRPRPLTDSHFTDFVVWIETDRDDLNIWQEGKSVYAAYIGSDEDRGSETKVTLTDISLYTSQPAVIKASDYVGERQ